LKFRPFESRPAIADRIPFNGEEPAMPNRRTFLQMAAGAAGSFLAHGGASAAETLRLITGFGPGSPTDIGARLIQAPFARAMGMTVAPDYVGGEGGTFAALELIRSKPDSQALLAADPFTLCLLDADGAKVLPRLKPIAAIGGGLSCALVVRDDSALKDWAGLVLAAKASLLAMANNDRMSSYLSAKDLMQKRAGLFFQPFVAGSAQAILDRVLTRQADLGTIDTRLALLHNDKAAATDKVRILATFGALRAPELPDVPTFAEIVGDPKAAYTMSVAVFCSIGADAAFASRATAALLSIAENEALRQDARQVRFPLRIEGPESVQATIARDSRVVRELYG
jgi:tripartite-type tricarboxylate transporter receptor subunit TctC